MKEINCCCRSTDAHRCTVLRHPELVKDWIGEDDGIDPDDYCDCRKRQSVELQQE